MQKELEKWKKKAERTPTVQLLQNQIENMKVGVVFVETLPILEAIVSARLRKIIQFSRKSHKFEFQLDYDKMLQEMSSKGKMNFESNDNSEKFADFESKIFRLSERIADCEKEKAELGEELKMSREENSTLVQVKFKICLIS